jgi:hypothetical protein
MRGGETMKLTAKQEAALVDAYKGGGRIFQLPENRRHSAAVLSSLVRRGLLKEEPVGTVWTLTESGRESLQQVY